MQPLLRQSGVNDFAEFLRRLGADQNGSVNDEYRHAVESSLFELLFVRGYFFVGRRTSHILLESGHVRTQTGRPLANDSFLSKLETKLGRRLRPLPPGRPTGWRKKTKEK